MFDKVFDLSTLNGTNGFRVPGLLTSNNALDSASNGGDINADGIDDLVIGAYGVNSNQGTAYVIFGQKNFTLQFNLSTLNGENGFVVHGLNASDGLGTSVSPAGDINADGIGDLVIGAWGLGENSNPGVAYVIFGQKNFTPQFNLSILNGNNGFVVHGLNAGDGLGRSVSRAGDINADGIDDLVIGALYVNSRRGAAYVIFGQKNFIPQFNLTTLNGGNGFVVHGLNPDDFLGLSVRTARDINADGIDDLVIGAPGYQGTAYVIFGQKNFTPRFNLSTLNGGNGFVVRGFDVRDGLGTSVSNAGDINADGIGDLVIGAGSNNNQGAAYVIFGQKNFTPRFNLSTLNGDNGFVIHGLNPHDMLGSSVSAAGDINADGIGDLVICAWSINDYQGVAYVIFGQKNFTPQFNLTILNGDNGFIIPGLNSGRSMSVRSTSGDINGDAIDDLAICVEQPVPVGANRGTAYVIFGNANNPPKLHNNNLLALQGKAVLLTTANINASDTRTPNTELLIIAGNVQHGQFEYVGQPEIAITNFTQHNVSTSAVQFRTDNSYNAPKYDILVKNKRNITSEAHNANITFHDAPRLTHNQLTIMRGQSVFLSSSNLHSSEEYMPEGNLIFSMSHLQHGKFQIVLNASNQSILNVTTFAQQNVTDGKVQFVHDGSEIAPSYAVSVSDGQLSSGDPANAKIDFKANPPVNNTLKIVLGTMGGVAIAGTMGVVGFFAYRSYKRTKELENMQDKLLGSPIATNPSDVEKQKLIDERESQKSSWGCQLF